MSNVVPVDQDGVGEAWASVRVRVGYEIDREYLAAEVVSSVLSSRSFRLRSRPSECFQAGAGYPRNRKFTIVLKIE
jgi:hypothetical protein